MKLESLAIYNFCWPSWFGYFVATPIRIQSSRSWSN